MKVIVIDDINGNKEEELTYTGKNGTDDALDIMCNWNDAPEYDDEQEAYTMSADAFEWWKEMFVELEELDLLISQLDAIEATEDERKAILDAANGTDLKDITRAQKIAIYEVLDARAQADGIEYQIIDQTRTDGYDKKTKDQTADGAIKQAGREWAHLSDRDKRARTAYRVDLVRWTEYETTESICTIKEWT